MFDGRDKNEISAYGFAPPIKPFECDVICFSSRTGKDNFARLAIDSARNCLACFFHILTRRTSGVCKLDGLPDLLNCWVIAFIATSTIGVVAA